MFKTYSSKNLNKSAIAFDEKQNKKVKKIKINGIMRQ